MDKLVGLLADVQAEAERQRALVQPRDVLEAMLSAAEAFAAEAERRGSLNLDLADAFKGLVLEACERRQPGERRERVGGAFKMLGKGGMVKMRNHWTVWERMAERVTVLRAFFRGDEESSPATDTAGA